MLEVLNVIPLEPFSDVARLVPQEPVQQRSVQHTVDAPSPAQNMDDDKKFCELFSVHQTQKEMVEVIQLKRQIQPATTLDKRNENMREDLMRPLDRKLKQGTQEELDRGHA